MALRLSNEVARRFGIMAHRPSRARAARPVLPRPPRAGDHILALDASSTAAGWVIITGGGRPVAWGLARPPAGREAADRIDRIVAEVVRVARTHAPYVVAMEWNSGRRSRRHPAAHHVSLGHAEGQVRQALLDAGRVVVRVSERAWTGGVPKAKRAAGLRLLFPDFAVAVPRSADPGLDVHDALGIALWLLGRPAR